jgi:hypothetical protein
LAAFLVNVADISIEPDPIYMAALNEQVDKNIDAGDAALYCVCPRIPDAIVVTGDKKSLRGLSETALTDEVCAKLGVALTGRIFCFEQVLESISDDVGFEAIRERLIRGRDCDPGAGNLARVRS